MTCKVIGNTGVSDILDIMPILEKLELRPDVSRYANGRLRKWINSCWDLKEKRFYKEHEDLTRNSRLWDFCKSIWPSADLGLVTYSGPNSTGISFHRDDSYADYKAIGINLVGYCDFIYMGGYPEYRWTKERDKEELKIIKLCPGDIVEFNCKNRHAARPSPNRWAINLWSVSTKYKEQFIKEMM